MTDDKKRPFWREPMMWLVLGLPAMSVVAGVILVTLATRDSSDSVGDVVTRTAQIQVADLGPDARARDLRGVWQEVAMHEVRSAGFIDYAGGVRASPPDTLAVEGTVHLPGADAPSVLRFTREILPL